MESQTTVGAIGAQGGPSSPNSVRNGNGSVDLKRKRSIAGSESSPGSLDVVENEEDEAERRRQPGVKRACNECRQQKVSREGALTDDGDTPQNIHSRSGLV